MPSVSLSFAKFLQDHKYTTQMWETPYTFETVNDVCQRLSLWGRTELNLQGEFLVIWAEQVGDSFRGDNELVYLIQDKAYLLPNPFIEGDAQGFIAALAHILEGEWGEFYEISLRKRYGYNAV